jgi:hypothetical protein
LAQESAAGPERRRSCRDPQQLAQPQHVVGRPEHVGSQLRSSFATKATAAEPAYRSYPAEDLLDPHSDGLADAVTHVTCRAAATSTSAPSSFLDMCDGILEQLPGGRAHRRLRPAGSRPAPQNCVHARLHDQRLTQTPRKSRARARLAGARLAREQAAEFVSSTARRGTTARGRAHRRRAGARRSTSRAVSRTRRGRRSVGRS